MCAHFGTHAACRYRLSAGRCQRQLGRELFGAGLRGRRREHCGLTDSRKRVLGGHTISFAGGYGVFFAWEIVAQRPDDPFVSLEFSPPAPTGDIW